MPFGQNTVPNTIKFLKVNPQIIKAECCLYNNKYLDTKENINDVYKFSQTWVQSPEDNSVLF